MSNCISSEHIQLLKQFIGLCDVQPALLHAPELAFFRQWLTKLGATLPSSKSHHHSESTKMDVDDENHASSSKHHDETSKAESEPESELELDMTGVIEPDNDPPQSMGDPDVEVTDAMLEQSDTKRGEAQVKLAEGAFEEAISLFTQAIENNPESAIVYAKRAQCYIKLNKPNAAIRDCNRALEINENSQQALKWRGKANRMLGNWEAAYKDFCKAQLSDFDEDVQIWCKEIEVNAKKVAEHKRKYERLRETKVADAKRERIRKAQEAYATAQQEESQRRAQEQRSNSAGARHSSGGMGGAAGLGELGGLMNDPEILEALQDPEVQKAFSEISTDPTKLAAYQTNPKVRKVMEKFANKFGGVDGSMGGGFPGFQGGMHSDSSANATNDLD